MSIIAVIPAKAGSYLLTAQRAGQRRSWVPAFAGMTMWLLAFLLFAQPATAQTFPKLTGRVTIRRGCCSRRRSST